MALEHTSLETLHAITVNDRTTHLYGSRPIKNINPSVKMPVRTPKIKIQYMDNMWHLFVFGPGLHFVQFKITASD